MEHSLPSSSRSPRPRLTGGRGATAGRMATTQPAPSQPQANLREHRMQPQAAPDSDRGAAELRALDCNLSALCDHIQVEGFNGGAFSDVVVHAMGSTYHLHRLILSRSSYFRNMLHGPWKEAAAPSLTLQIDDNNVNLEAIGMALAYLYGHHPKLNDNNAFRVLAAASFLDLEDLCALCTDFIISELWTSNFLAYQIFAEKQDYGMHGERVRKACWGYLCQCGTMELREVLPKLSSQTLHALLTSDRLWVPNEEKRFELALYTLLGKATLLKEEEQARLNSESGYNPSHDPSTTKGKQVIEECNVRQQLVSKFEQFSIGNSSKGQKPARNILVEFADCVVDFQNNLSYSKPAQVQPFVPSFDPHSCNLEPSASTDGSFSNVNPIQASSSYSSVQNNVSADRMGNNDSATEGPSEEGACYHIDNNIWLSGEQPGCILTDRSSNNAVISSEIGNSGTSSSWGARTIGTRQDNIVTVNPGIRSEDYEAFVNIFEGGSVLYCNMSFEALLNVRRQLEDLGFPCKAVNDGLWLQTLLSHRVQELGADTCRNCSFTSISCACQQPYGYSQRNNSVGYYRQELDRNSESGNLGNVYLADTQGGGAGMYGPVRVHVRGPIDGLAGIGRGTTFVSGSAWPPTRFVFSRVPFGMGSRNCQHTLANEESEARVDINGDLSGDGLTALVGSSQGGNSVSIHMEHTERAYVPGPATVPNTNDLPVQMLDTQEHSLGLGWESTEVSSISLDLKAPLRHFPPFRFGVEFEDVLRLGDGQVKHSPEVCYAGSLWKVSVQAFNDEDPQGRRTLGLFLHRRKADPTDSLQKVHLYVDSREKVTARYQLICPSKREIMVFGSLRQPGTLLPKAPKGWGWRTALLFDELPDLLQSGALRVAAVVQLI